MDLKALQDRIVELGGRMRTILEGVDQVAGMTDEQRTEFDAIDGERKRLLATEERARLLEESETRLALPEGRRSMPAQPNQNVLEVRRQPTSRRDSMECLRGWLLSGSHVGATQKQQELAKRVGLNLASKNICIRLSDEALQSTRHTDVKEWEERALSTLNTSSPVDGYYTIADEPMRELEIALLAFGGMRQRSTIIRTGTGAALPIPTVNDTSNKGEILTENTIVNNKDVTFNQLVLNSYKYSSKQILVSVELMQDSSVNLAAFLGRALGERIGRILNEHFTTGDGSAKPNGLLNATTASGTQLAAQTPTLAELIAIQHSVDPAYRTNAAWMFHDSMLAEVKKMVDASSGRPIWMPNMIGGQPDTILGDPYVINQDMVAAAGSGAGKLIAYGDLSKYLIRDVRDITLLRLDERYADYHQVAFLAFSRHDGDLLDAGTHPVKHALNKT